MFEKPRDWQEYYENTKENEPETSLVQAIQFVKARDTALDLGAGSLNETKFLLNSGFSKVIAVDKEESIQKFKSDLDPSRVEVVISKMEDFNYPKDTYDLVNAQYSLPFIPPQSFETVFKRIIDSLKKEGIFVGQFFGNRDQWSHSKDMTFLTKDEADKVLESLKILRFKEIEKQDLTALGFLKNWHFFEIIAQKS